MHSRVRGYQLVMIFCSEKGVKSLEKDPNILPAAVIYDSKFLLETPPHLITSTGLRALDHAMEIMYHSEASEFTRQMALQAAAKLFKYLPLYNKNPKDEAVITQLCLGAYSALGFLGKVNAGLGLSHALGYALGSPYGIPHGITSCITLGAVVKMKAQSDDNACHEIARMVPFIGLQSTSDTKKDAEAVSDAIVKLVQELGLTTKLRDKGVGEDQVPVIVKRASGKESGPEFEKLKGLVRSLL
jgi:alcohol dehydrogenase class IV